MISRKIFSDSDDCIHYAFHVLWDIYPLSEDEYRMMSVERRASYDYLVQIIEMGYKLVGIVLKNQGEFPVKGYRARFIQAQEANILSNTFVRILNEFALLRNKSVHENKRINKELSLYPQLGSLVLVGFALWELFDWRNRKKNYYEKLEFGPAYLEGWLKPSEMISNDPQEREHALEHELTKKRALAKLKKDKQLPVFTIACPNSLLSSDDYSRQKKETRQ